MPATSTFRGHPIRFDASTGEWLFDDDGAPVKDSWKGRPCGYCGAFSPPDAPDACLGHLPGVANACCGHGVQSESYVQFENGVVLRGFKIERQEAK